MKKCLALATLSTKLSMLLCVSGMGLFGAIQESFAEKQSPCHQEVAQEGKTQAPCEMCKTALAAWEENAIEASAVELIKVPNFTFAIDILVESFIFELSPSVGVYKIYYPPPQVLLKAVTPNTKTIVLLS